VCILISLHIIRIISRLSRGVGRTLLVQASSKDLGNLLQGIWKLLIHLLLVFLPDALSFPVSDWISLSSNIIGVFRPEHGESNELSILFAGVVLEVSFRRGNDITIGAAGVFATEMQSTPMLQISISTN
jgi:hypothetical protein